MRHVLSILLAFPLAFTSPAGASDEPIREDDYLIPAIVQGSGQNSAQYTSDVTIANPGPSEMTLEFYLNGPVFEIKVPARSSRSLGSAEILTLAGVPDGTYPTRVRVKSPAGAVAAMTLFVQNTLAAGGTYGLSFPVERLSDSVLEEGDTGMYFSGSIDDSERLNIGLFAPFGPAAATVETYDAFGLWLGARSVTLAPRERVQLTDVLKGRPTGCRVFVKPVEGSIFTYGTSVSNSQTNDPYRVPALLTSWVSDTWTIPAVAAAPGRAGAYFTSDVFLATLPGTHDYEPPVTLTYRPRDGSAPLTRTTQMLMGSTRILFDVVTEFFPNQVPGAGVLEISSPWKFLAFSVTRSTPATGPSSQDQPAVRPGGELTGPAVLPGLSENEGFRSNVLVSNTGDEARLSLTLLTPEGPMRPVEVTLAKGEIRQFDSVIRLFSPNDIPAASLLIEPGAGAKLTVSSARIDNQTNDPAGIQAVKLPR